MQNAIIGVAGMKGHGKSTWVKQNLRGEERLLMIDTLGDHAEWCKRFPSNNLGEQVLGIARAPDRFQWSFSLPPDTVEINFDFLARAAFLRGQLTLMVEEIDYFSNPQANQPGLDLLIRYGRHQAVNLVYTSRNLAEISRRLTSQTDLFVLFRITEPRYIEALAERLTDEIADEVAQLERFNYIRFALEDGSWSRGTVTAAA